MERSLWQLTDAELRDATEDSFRRLQEAEAAYLEHLLELDSRPGAVPGARPGRVAVTFARDKLRRSCAAADVRAAHALAEELPMLGKALAAGEVSREHVDGAVRVLKQIPRHLLGDPEAMGKVDAWFTETSQSLAPLQADKAAKHLLHRLDPDGGNTFDPHSFDRRELTTAVDGTGMVVIRGQLDPANGAAFLAALDALSAPVPVDPESELPIPDDRSKGQRQADAAGLMARIALKEMGQGRAETDRPKVVIHLPAGEEQHLGALTPAWLARFACDSIVEAVDPDKLLLGHAVRTATTAQRRFLAARDGGCVIPGCHAPPGWTDAHHVDWWSTGGRHRRHQHGPGLRTASRRRALRNLVAADHRRRPVGDPATLDRPGTETGPQHLPATPPSSRTTRPRPQPTRVREP